MDSDDDDDDDDVDVRCERSLVMLCIVKLDDVWCWWLW